MAFLSMLLTGGCEYDTSFAASGNGAFTFWSEGPYLYVTDEGSSGDGKLLIYDITNPDGPVLKSTTSLPTDSTPRNPYYSGGMLFIPYRDAANVVRYVAIWDVSNPSSPSLVGQTANMAGTTGKPVSCRVIGTTLMIAVQFGTYYAEKHNISNPASPSFVSGLTNTGGINCTGAGQAGGLFLVTGQFGSGGPDFVRSINTSSMAVAGSVGNGANGTGGGGALVTNSAETHLYTPENNSDRLWTVDISDLSNLVSLSRVDMTQTGTQTTATGSVEIVERLNRVYVGRANGGGLLIPIMDITDPDNPAPSGSISTNGETVTDIKLTDDGCIGLIYGQGTGAAIHIIGEPPTS